MLGRLSEEHPDVRRLMSEQPPSTVGIELLLHSIGNCSVIKAAGLFWASAELHVFATTEQSVHESRGLQSTSKEQWRLSVFSANSKSTNGGKLKGV